MDRALLLAGVAALLLLTVGQARAATPGLPFTEDFSDDALRDAALTNANWSTREQALLLAFRERRYGVFAGSTGSDIDTDADLTHSIDLGDVDGDGDLDLVVGNSNARNRLYLNNGSADPWNGVSGSDITTDAEFTASVALGDVDGDGDFDLVAGNSDARNRLYLNNGMADPWNGVSGSDITTDTEDTLSVALGDVDGDGDLDLVAGNSSQTNRLYLNNGSADPWSGVSGSDVTTDMDLTNALALGDVNGDGALDLVAGNNGQTNRLYLNNGSADPWNGVSGSDITADASPTRSVMLGDMDGDGDLDLVAGNSTTNRLYLNNGEADPWNGVTASLITTHPEDTFAVALGDVDGDGELDLVAGNNGQVNRSYLSNGTANPWNGASGSDITTDTDNTRPVALGDVDGDGDLDLVAGGLTTNRLYLNNGSADPWSGVSGSDITTDADSTLAVALGDVDGDGDLDLVAGNSAINRLYLNNGTADPWNGVSGSDITTDTGFTFSVALGDADGDGDLDLVAGNRERANRLYLNNGTTSPWIGVSGSDITTDDDDTLSVALGDVDGDGDLDLVVGNRDQTNRLYPNNGGADPWNGVSGSDVTTDADYTISVALGDVDGDGDLDLVAGNRFEAKRLYLNNGTADPWNGVSGSELTSDADNLFSVALGDVDGDGDLDLVAGIRDQTIRLYRATGGAGAWNGVAGSAVTTDADYTISMALGDVDGDGDLDLVAGNRFEAKRLYLNNGTA
ncbi:MAG: hypothetical protein GY716_13230, partial [bacterium]|nr:hypothetical protein [bacterium]